MKKDKATLPISMRDLRALVHWACVGIENAKGGYCQDDIIEIVQFHNRRTGYMRRKPEWGIARANPITANPSDRTRGER